MSSLVRVNIITRLLTGVTDGLAGLAAGFPVIIHAD